MKYLYIFILIIILYSCNSFKYKRDTSGLEYQIVERSTDTNNKKLQYGDVVVLNLSYEIEGGEVLYTSASQNRRYLRQLNTASHSGGSFEDGLALLHEGDSAIFRINAEKFLQYTESYKTLPKIITSEDFILVKLRVIEILEHNEYESLLTEQYHKSEEVELQLLSKYLENANIQTSPTSSGLYYIDIETGSGKQAQIGDYVQIHYTLTLIDGRLIETTLDKKPIYFKVGEYKDIKGMNEGICYMREGGSAKLIIPSSLGYGSMTKNDILPYSTLIFEIQLISIR